MRVEYLKKLFTDKIRNKTNIIIEPPLQIHEIQANIIKHISGRFILSIDKNGEGPVY